MATRVELQAASLDARAKLDIPIEVVDTRDGQQDKWIGDVRFDQLEVLERRKQEGEFMAAQAAAIHPVTLEPAKWPAFINVRFEGQLAIVTLRADPTEIPATEAVFTVETWDQFINDALKERELSANVKG